MIKQVLISAVVILGSAQIALAQSGPDWIKDQTGVGNSSDSSGPDWIKDTSSIGQSQNGTVRSDQILELGTCPPSALQLEGEHSLRIGNIEHALTALQRSVEMAPLDMEKRILYAQALEKKMSMKKGGDQDPVLYNFLIKQYLFIYRKAEFIDQTLLAKSRLVSLTGTAPKSFEKSEKFLARVMVPEDGSLKLAHKKSAAPSSK